MALSGSLRSEEDGGSGRNRDRELRPGDGAATVGQTLPRPLRDPSKEEGLSVGKSLFIWNVLTRDTTLSWGALQREFDGEKTVSIFLIWAFALF